MDIFAVLGTMFGVATSLGFGVLQVNAGFNHLFGLPTNPLVQIILIAVITGLATLSAVAGLDKGIKRLSELNIILAIALLVFVLFAGSTVFLLQAYVQNRSEEHTSELQSLMRISYAVFCLKKKKKLS